MCVFVCVCVWLKSVMLLEARETESCKHTLEAELKLSIGRGMLSHRDQSLTLIDDICLFVCLCVRVYVCACVHACVCVCACVHVFSIFR